MEMLGDKPPSFEELKSLRYLGWTIRESKCEPYSRKLVTDPRIAQRPYPVIPVNSRVAVVDTLLPLGGCADGSHQFSSRKELVSLISHTPCIAAKIFTVRTQTNSDQKGRRN